MQKLQIKGHQDFLGVNIPIIEGGFGENNRVMLVKTIADIHEMQTFKINEIINNNRDEFEDGIDIIDLKSVIRSTDKELITKLNELGINQNAINKSNNIYLLSEQGYMALVSLMKNSKAKEIRKQLRREYFSMREQLKIDERTLLLSNIINSQDVEQALAIQKFEQYVKKPLLETINNQEKIIATQKPKVEYCDNVLKCDRLLSTTVIAKDLGISARKLNQILTSYKVIYKRNGTYVPYSNYQWLITKGYADYFIYEDKNVPQQLKWTEKGRKWIIDSINKLKNNGLERNFISE